MPSLTIGLETPENLFNTQICERIEPRSMMVVHRNVCYDLSGEGLGSFLQSIFSKGVNLYNKAKPYVDKGLKIYNTATDLAEKAQKVYQSDEFQKLKNKLPPSVLQKEQQLISKATPYYQKAKSFENEAKDKFQKGLTVGKDYWKQAEDIANKVDTTFGLDTPEKKMPGDGLRMKLLKLEGSKRKMKGQGRRLIGCGDILPGMGDILPGMGAILPGMGVKLAGEGYGVIIKKAMKMIPAIIDGIQAGSGMNDMTKKQLMNLTQEQVKKILPGVMTPLSMSGDGFFEDLANVVMTPLSLISKIVSPNQNGNGKAKKGKVKLNKFKKDVAKILRQVHISKQKGTGISFSDVLSSIGQVASTILPFIL